MRVLRILTTLGTEGEDEIYGTEGHDVIHLLGADDSARAARAEGQPDVKDFICGGTESDRLAGDAGNDWIDGERGNDGLADQDGTGCSVAQGTITSAGSGVLISWTVGKARQSKAAGSSVVRLRSRHGGALWTEVSASRLLGNAVGRRYRRSPARI